jgi:hypothetical protein
MKSLSTHEISGIIVAITESLRILSKSSLSEKIFEEKSNVIIAVLYPPDGRVVLEEKLIQI